MEMDDIELNHILANCAISDHPTSNLKFFASMEVFDNDAKEYQEAMSVHPELNLILTRNTRMSHTPQVIKGVGGKIASDEEGE